MIIFLSLRALIELKFYNWINLFNDLLCQGGVAKVVERGIKHLYGVTILDRLGHRLRATSLDLVPMDYHRPDFTIVTLQDLCEIGSTLVSQFALGKVDHKN